MYTLILFTMLQPQQSLMDQYIKQNTLNAIKQVESRNCEKVNHKVMRKGIHKGQAAQGCYGLMPKTIKDVIRTINKDDLDRVWFYDQNALNDQLREEYIASMLYDRLNTKYKRNMDKVIYSWLNGSTKRKNVKGHWYVKRVLASIK
jgi:hypothetical protein